jgi:hypothetical protein
MNPNSNSGNPIDTEPENRGDADASGVINILEGARRAERDPDVDLSRLIIELHSAPDDAIQSALAFLVANADPD